MSARIGGERSGRASGAGAGWITKGAAYACGAGGLLVGHGVMRGTGRHRRPDDELRPPRPCACGRCWDRERASCRPPSGPPRHAKPPVMTWLDDHRDGRAPESESANGGGCAGLPAEVSAATSLTGRYPSVGRAVPEVRGAHGREPSRVVVTVSMTGTDSRNAPRREATGRAPAGVRGRSAVGGRGRRVRWGRAASAVPCPGWWRSGSGRRWWRRGGRWAGPGRVVW